METREILVEVLQEARGGLFDLLDSEHSPGAPFRVTLKALM
jgi:hypothetical protein